MGKIVMEYLSVKQQSDIPSQSQGHVAPKDSGRSFMDRSSLMENTAMRNFALCLMAFAIMFNACASESGNSGPGNSSNWVQPQADAGSSSDSNNAQQADSGNQPQPDQQVVECVDLSVNDGVYDCQDGNPLTTIVANPETCEYQAEMWYSTPDKTQVLDGAKRVIAKTGVFTRDCVRKEAK